MGIVCYELNIVTKLSDYNYNDFGKQIPTSKRFLTMGEGGACEIGRIGMPIRP